MHRLDEFKHQMSRQGWNQAPQELWVTDRIKERIPIMDIEAGGVIIIITIIILIIPDFKNA